VFNAGNANACNADQGLADAREMTAITADLLHIASDLVLVASTGVIGRPLPMAQIRGGLPRVQLRSDGGPDAARAIMTTDTRPKTAGARFVVQGREVTIGAMVKGVGMIHPTMATMLAFLATDAALEPDFAGQTLKLVVDRTFNMVTVDGDTSTNDSCFLLANGLSETPALTANAEGAASFEAALESVCTRLARAMAADGEGATKLITVDITGARSEADARAAAREVVRSSLVKAAVHGEDPNWGRVFAAVGNSSAIVDPLRAALWVGPLQIARNGQGLGVSEEETRAQMSGDEVTFRVDLGLGTASARAWGCDLTEAYVVENSAYTT
jgi:glutamate N-acetyltransferase/amino-acid N-acetyltransferase